MASERPDGHNIELDRDSLAELVQKLLDGDVTLSLSARGFFGDHNQLSFPLRSLAGQTEAEYLLAGLKNQPGVLSSSDPKHLPPRDCLVLYDVENYGARLFHAEFNATDGAWFAPSPYGGQPTQLDPSRVITWRELPEVE